MQKKRFQQGRTHFRSGLFALIGSMLFAGSLSAQVANYAPDALKKIDVVEKLEQPVATDVVLVNSAGDTFQVADFLDGERPVILVLAYYNCPMLCSLVLNGLTDAAKATELAVGKDYKILTVSIEPRENAELAAAKKENYVKALGAPGAKEGWAFCVTDSAQSSALAESIGFEYYWDEEQQIWAHPAVLTVLTPDGVISRYLYGLSYKPNDLKLALLEAAQGKIGNTIDKIVLYCFHYDPDAKGYVVLAGNVMRLGGIVTVIILAIFLGILWVRFRVISSSNLNTNGKTNS